METQHDENKVSVKNLIDDIKKYLSLKFEAAELNFVEKLALLVGKIMMLGVMALFTLGIVLLMLFLLHNALILWINEAWLAIVIEIGFVGLLMIIVWALREKLIIRPVSNMIVKVIYGAKNDQSNESQEGKDYE